MFPEKVQRTKQDGDSATMRLLDKDLEVLVGTERALKSVVRPDVVTPKQR
jgi:hypothetical protein